MQHYISKNSKRFVTRNNGVASVHPKLFNHTQDEIEFSIVDAQNQLQDIPSGNLYFAASYKKRNGNALILLCNDFEVSGKVLKFTYSTNNYQFLNLIQGDNVEVSMEIGVVNGDSQQVILSDFGFASQRYYIEGMPEPEDLASYYTKTEMNAILSGYATKQYVDERIPVVSGFATKEYVDAQDAYLSGQIDLKATTASLTAHTTDSTIHVTSTEKAAWTAKQNAITADNKLDYALISGHPEIPTKTSDLENDSDFQTSAQVTTAITTAISGKADKTYVDSQDSALQNAIDTKQNIINSSNKLDYALISGNPAIPTKTSDLENDSDFQTSTQVTTAISGKADTSTVTAHTSDTTIHVTAEDKAAWTAKADVEDIPLSTSQLTNDSDFTTKTYVDAQDATLNTAIGTKQNAITVDNKLDYSLISGNPSVEVSWGNISGTLSAQTDLKNALDDKANTSYVDNNPSVSESLSGLNDIFYCRIPLCFELIDKTGDSNLSITKYNGYDVDIEYSFDNATWHKVIFQQGSDTVNIAFNGSDKKIYVRGSNVYSRDEDNNIVSHFSIYQKNYKISGNIMSLVDKIMFPYIKTLTRKCAFSALFSYDDNLVDAGDLILPATELSQYCYDSMFRSCRNLRKAPKLPALSLANYCYMDMFNQCTSLTTAPLLPATSLPMGCYAGMFRFASSLNNVNVNFTDFNTIGSSTIIWLQDVAASGSFTCTEELQISGRSDSTVPEGWTIIRK